jgi:hypothetical protein
MIYALIVALGWGAAAGYLHAPYITLVIGALVAAALCLWQEQETLKRSANTDHLNRYLLAAAYAFLAMIGLGLSGVAYAGVTWLLHR